jgi:D-serine deaminase-like pyridoxal phosphate-dependent protein
MCIDNGSVRQDDCALRVLATVVSRPTRDRAILDAGSKTLTSDRPPMLTGHGLVVEHPDAAVMQLHEEHGIVDVSRCADPPAIGDVVTVIPNHACGVTNLHDEVVVHRGGEIVDTWRVAARGTVR